MNLLGAIDFSGIGAAADKKKKDAPAPPKPLPTGAAPAKSALPKWAPWALGGVGVLVVVGLLVTSKGKD